MILVFSPGFLTLSAKRKFTCRKTSSGIGWFSSRQAEWLETVGLTQRAGEGGEGATQQRLIRWSSAPEVQPLTCRKQVQVYIQLFRERLSQKLHATIPKSIVVGFIWVHCSSKKFQRMARKGMDECFKVLKESVKRGSVKWRLRTDCRLLFLGLENNGFIVVTYSFAWWKQ